MYNVGRIFRVLKTPTEELWPGVTQLPDFKVRNVGVAQHRRREFSYVTESLTIQLKPIFVFIARFSTYICRIEYVSLFYFLVQTKLLKINSLRQKVFFYKPDFVTNF